MTKYFILLLLFTTIVGNSQRTVKITYQQQNYFPSNYFNNIPEDLRQSYKEKLSVPRNFVLTNNGEYSLYTSIDQADDLDLNDIVNKKIKNKLLQPGTWILKDFFKNTSYRKQYILNNEYIIKENFNGNPKTLSKAVKKIGKYDCKLAYVVSNKNVNDTIKYWYTDEIAIIDGPFVPQDVPGLILGYEQKNKTIFAIKIEFDNNQLQIEAIKPSTKVYTNEEFNILKKEILDKKEIIDSNGKTIKILSD